MLYKLIKLPLFIVSTLCTSVLTAAPLTPNELHATMGIVTNFILSDDNIRFHGKSYQPVTSPHTGRVWLDRNIGANKTCASFEDTQCYGDYFQWGRKYDGHQSSVDSTTILASDINNAGAEYIRGTFDWASTDASYGNARATNWLKTDGSTVCPVGYRVPLRSELEAEVGDISNKETAYANFLKLPAAGYRSYNNANYNDADTWGTVWSVSSTENRASYFSFHSGSNWNDNGARAWGLSVRCIKHVGRPLIYHSATSYETVVSPHTGKVWLDRNLGASQVCTSFDDAACYGDYYQWGRNADGHEDSDSATTTVLAGTVTTVGHGDFITSGFATFYDWARTADTTGVIRATNWSKTDGSSVCPLGFRVPINDELKSETTEATTVLAATKGETGSPQVTDRDTAFRNFLKLPSAGHRVGTSGSLVGMGSWGHVWTSSVGGSFSSRVGFDSGNAFSGDTRRANGFTVRCLRD